MLNKTPIDIVYIAGTGRSGSTLLDRMLGQYSDIESLGEVRFLWERGIQGEYLCGCGLKVTECNQWTNILRLLEKKIEIDIPAIIDRAHELGLHKTKNQINRKARTFPDKYLHHKKLLISLYDSIRTYTGKEWLVDSSKAVSYARLLSDIPDTRLHIIHLIRDPRAYTYSLRKMVWDKGSGNMLMTNVSALHAVMDWIYVNSGIRRLKSDCTSYVVVKYEDLIRSPKSEINRILESLSYGEPTEQIFPSENEVLLDTTHTASGNPSRLQKGRIRLRVDEAWQDKLPISDKMIASTALPLYHIISGRR